MSSESTTESPIIGNAALETNVVQVDSDRIEKLTGRKNFLGWRKAMMVKLEEKGYLTSIKKDISEASSHGSAPLALLTKNMSLDVLASAPTEDGARAVWEHLHETYGFGDDWTHQSQWHKWGLNSLFKL